MILLALFRILVDKFKLNINPAINITCLTGVKDSGIRGFKCLFYKYFISALLISLESLTPRPLESLHLFQLLYEKTIISYNKL